MAGISFLFFDVFRECMNPFFFFPLFFFIFFIRDSVYLVRVKVWVRSWRCARGEGVDCWRRM